MWLLLLISLALHVLTLWLLWSHLQIMQTVQRSLRVWDRPEHLATPAPEPGTTWLMGDAELAAIEAQQAADSRHRAQSRRGWPRPIAPSAESTD